MEGGRSRLARAAAVLALGCWLAACGDETEQRPVRPVATTDPARTFAPLVHIHAKERWYPMSTDRFLRHSTLEWSGGPCPFEINVAAGPVSQRITGEGAPRLVPRRLGNEPAYRVRPRAADCKGRRQSRYATTQPTRPYGEGERPAGLRADEGYNLDVLMATYKGQRLVERRRGQAVLDGVPVYYERKRASFEGRPASQLTYSWVYALQEAVDARGREVLSQEGDWERVDVLVRRRGDGRYVPLAVRIHRDGVGETVPWQSLKLARAGAGPGSTHPVIFSALRSHDPYPEAGRHSRRLPRIEESPLPPAVDVTAACRDCPTWRTWEHLRAAQREPWYGYGGGWGLRGLMPELAGPPGPSPFTREI